MLKGLSKKKGVKLLILLVFLLSLGQVIFGLSKVLGQTDLIDFRVYYEASQDFLQGINPYQQLYSLNIPYNYPPSAFIFFLPMVLIPLEISQIVWLLFSFLFLFAFVGLLFQLYWPQDKVWFGLLATSFLLQNFPTKFTLVMGQANFLVLLLITVSFFFYVKRKSTFSGIFLGLAAALKISPILLVIFFLMRKKFKTAISACLTFVMANLIFVPFSLKVVKFYFETTLPGLFATSSQGLYYDQSFLAFVSRLGLGTPLGRVLNLLFLLSGIIFLLFKFKKRKASLADLKLFSLLFLLFTITNIFAWQHHLVFLFPAFLGATFHFLKRKEFLYGLVLALAAFLVGFHFRDPQHYLLTNPLITSHGFLGVLILGGLLLK